MFAWKVEPCALSEPLAQPLPVAAALEPAAELGEVVATPFVVEPDGACAPLLSVPHAATASRPLATSAAAAAVREVLTNSSSCIGRSVE